jgi:hypothetical protein
LFKFWFVIIEKTHIVGMQSTTSEDRRGLFYSARICLKMCTFTRTPKLKINLISIYCADFRVPESIVVNSKMQVSWVRVY